jgi:hypothetical protein
MILTSPAKNTLSPLMPWLAFAWLLGLSGVLMLQQVSISDLIEQSRDNDQYLQMQSALERIKHLEQYREQTEKRPPPIVQQDLDALREALEKRLTELEQALPDAQAAIELQAIKDQVQSLAAKLETLTQPPVNNAMPVTKTNVRRSEQGSVQPFQVIGFELRGGERFLAIATGSRKTLEQIGLMRPGDSVGRWQLENFESQTAVFRVAGKVRRVTVP